MYETHIKPTTLCVDALSLYDFKLNKILVSRTVVPFVLFADVVIVDIATRFVDFQLDGWCVWRCVAKIFERLVASKQTKLRIIKTTTNRGCH